MGSVGHRSETRQDAPSRCRLAFNWLSAERCVGRVACPGRRGYEAGTSGLVVSFASLRREPLCCTRSLFGGAPVAAHEADRPGELMGEGGEFCACVRRAFGVVDALGLLGLLFELCDALAVGGPQLLVELPRACVAVEFGRAGGPATAC